MTVLLRSDNVKARKEHRCNYCSGVIFKGEVYENSACASDGRVYTWKAHLDCVWIALKLKMFEEENLTGDDFIEWIHEEYITLGGESKKLPFKDRLSFVIKHYRNESNKSSESR